MMKTTEMMLYLLLGIFLNLFDGGASSSYSSSSSTSSNSTPCAWLSMYNTYSAPCSQIGDNTDVWQCESTCAANSTCLTSGFFWFDDIYGNGVDCYYGGSIITQQNDTDDILATYMRCSNYPQNLKYGSPDCGSVSDLMVQSSPNYTDESMTYFNCGFFCRSQPDEYMYSALSNGNSCLCTNGSYLPGYPEDCTEKCSGDTNFFCGSRAVDGKYSFILNVYECDWNPCDDYNVCVDNIDGYSCVCKPSFTAESCSKEIVPSWDSSVIGCFADVNRLDLSFMANLGPSSLTPSNCIQACQAQNYSFAAVQNGLYCLCGDTIGRFNEYATMGRCNKSCPGAPGLQCGGVDSNAIMHTQLYALNMAEIGCFFTSDQLMNFTFVVDTTTTPVNRSFCASQCFYEKFKYAGLDNGQNCRCGNTYVPPRTQTQPPRCDMICVGDRIQRTVCGGSNSMSILDTGYFINACENSSPCLNGGECQSNSTGYVCVCAPGYTDRQCGTVINFCESNPCRGITLRCIPKINSYECVCPINYSGPGCSKAYIADWNTSVIGCYTDRNISRDLPVRSSSAGLQHPSDCVAQCESLEFSYSGAQNGDECYCGDTFGKYGTSTSCNVTCSNNDSPSSDVCGGLFANTIMHTRWYDYRYNNLGCFGGLNLAFGGISDTKHTVASCAGHCYNLGYKFTMVNKWVCYCGNAYLSPYQVDPYYCWDHCFGDPMGIANCGNGASKYTLFDTGAAIDPCDVGACMNNGTCTSTRAHGMFSCICEAGFTGYRCQTNINECASSPCLNSGTCVDGINLYTCTCLAHSNGSRCENIGCPVIYQCMDPGVCFQTKCWCPMGYSGQSCEVKQGVGCPEKPCKCVIPPADDDVTCLCNGTVTPGGCPGVLVSNLNRTMLGCYKDSPDPRDLPRLVYTGDILTHELCVDLCQDNGFMFAGVQAGIRCYCGNSYGRYGVVDKCDVPCSGFADELCGGNISNYVIRTNFFSLNASILGCFLDDLLCSDLPYEVLSDDQNSAVNCTIHCYNKNYRYAAARNGSRCSCSNSFGMYGVSTDCRIPCPGDQNTTCGGNESNSVFSTLLADIPACDPDPCMNDGHCEEPSTVLDQFACQCLPGFTGVMCQTQIDWCASCPCTDVLRHCVNDGDHYNCTCHDDFMGDDCELEIVSNWNQSTIACFDEPSTVTSLSKASNMSLTSRQCHDLCLSLNYLIYGFETRFNSCFCGSSYSDDYVLCNPLCISNSPGKNPGSVCTEAVMAIQHTTLFNWVANLGCFMDKYTLRDFSLETISDPSINISQCALHCFNKGYMYGACQNGTVCSCGNTYGLYGPSSASQPCDRLCPGDVYNRTVCGGKGVNTVVQTGIVYKPCSTNPCQNGGQCIPPSSSASFYQCLCQNGTTGAMCETDINECLSQPCHSPRNACMDGMNRFTCQCPEGSIGPNCSSIPVPFALSQILGCYRLGNGSDVPFEPLVDPMNTLEKCSFYCTDKNYKYSAISNRTCSCGNQYGSFGNGSCAIPCPGNGSMVCDGKDSYTVAICKTIPKDPCYTNPCPSSKHLCIRVPNSDQFTCVCPPGFNGTSCEALIDNCASNPCRGQGQCKSFIGNFNCMCPPKFGGKLCEVKKSADSMVCAQPGSIPPNTSALIYRDYSGSSAIYICTAGHKYKDGTRSRTSTCSNKTWSPMEGCKAYPPCKVLPTPGVDIRIHGSLITARCSYPGELFADGLPVNTRICVYRDNENIARLNQPLSRCADRCLPPPLVGNATLSYDSDDRLATFRCFEGYLFPTGNEEREETCNPDGTWNRIPSCEITYCKSLSWEHGGVTSKNVVYGSETTAYCDEGFMFGMGNCSVALKCVSRGPRWNVTLHGCQPVYCLTPAPVPNSNSSGLTLNGTDAHYPYRKVVYYSCQHGDRFQDGYTEKNVTCTRNGTWDETDLDCDKNRCPPVPKVEKATPNTTHTSFGAVIMYSCVEGFSFSGKINLMTRCVDGFWTELDPGNRCRITTCPDLNLNHANKSTSETISGTSVDVTCELGYRALTNQNSSTTVTCSSRGIWAPSFNDCLPVDCGPPPNISTGMLEPYSSTKFPNLVTFSCPVGFWFSRNVLSKTVQCGPTGHWALETLDPCTQIECLPFIISIPSSNDVRAGVAVVNVTCPDGMSFTEDPRTWIMTSCSAKGSWIPAVPKCVQSVHSNTSVALEAEGASVIGICSGVVVGVAICALLAIDIASIKVAVHLLKKNIHTLREKA